MRPTALAVSVGITPIRERTSRMEAATEAWKTLAWRSVQNPPGSSATTLPTLEPRRTSSSPILAPIELPATSTPSRPCSPMKDSTVSVSVATDSPPGTGGVSPNPGRSTAITSR